MVDICCSILITAFVGTAIAFACFSGAALVSKRREYLYLGGLLSSGLSILVWLQFASSLFGQSAAGFKIEVVEEKESKLWKCVHDSSF